MGADTESTTAQDCQAVANEVGVPAPTLESPPEQDTHDPLATAVASAVASADLEEASTAAKEQSEPVITARRIRGPVDPVAYAWRSINPRARFPHELGLRGSAASL
jgi:hypothetical protein